jgi:hypothetical protein
VRRLITALSLAVAFGSVSAEDVSLEYQVKATYLYNFVKFVEWPAAARSGPLNICVAGRNPFGAFLDDLLRGEVVEGRPLTSRVILEPDADCHVLFIPSGGAASAYLRGAHGKPTLTVGETGDFLQQGGIIAFVMDEGHVRFAVSANAADEAKLKVSSRLLQLAVNTRGHR